MNTKHCESCPLHSCQSKVATKGKGKYLVVTDPPTASASLHGRVFTPAMAGVFQKVFSKAGFEAADFSYHPAVCCPYDEREFTNAENKIIRAQCRQHLREAVRAIRPEVIIPLGAMAARQVAGHPVKITKVRGVPVFNDEFQCMVLPMYHPGFVAKYPQHQSVFLADALTLNDLEYFNYDVNRLEQSRYGEYELIEDLQFLIDLQPKRLAFDLETLGTRWYIPGAKILTMQFCTEPGRAYMLLWDHPESRISLRTKRKLKGQLRQLLQNPRTEVVNHNLLYDRTWVQWHLDIAFPISHDTLMLAALLDENSNSKDQSTLVKQYVPEMAGYDDCVLPHTRLLTADLRWVRAGEVQPGDELMGFDEEVPLEGCRRKLRVATAVSTKRLVKPCVRIRMSSGRVIECSEDHGFLSSGAEVGSLRWRRAYQLSLGDRLKLAAPDVEPLTSFDAGWMSGFLDGEGYCSRVKTGNHEVTGSHTFCLGWSQNPGKVHDKAKRIVQDIDMGVLGYGLSEVPDNRKECITTKLMGWNALKVMMLFRPERLIEKQVWAGAAIPREDFTDTIASIQSIGEQEVVSLETSTHTFVAEGICSHNSFNSKYSKDRMDLVPVSELLQYGCLTYESLVKLGDGSWQPIGELVEQRYAGEVMTYDPETEVITTRRVIGWHKDDCGQEEWYQLRTTGSREGRWGLMGPKFTPDHGIYTQRGYVRVDELVVGQDRVLTDEVAYSEDQISVLLGSALGDGGFNQKNSARYGFRFGQRAHIEYAEWKAGMFLESRQIATAKGRRYALPYSAQLTEWGAYLEPFTEGEGPRRRVIPNMAILELLGDLGIAVWYQDDGTLVNGEGCRIYAKLPSVYIWPVCGWFAKYLDVSLAEVTYSESANAICFSRVATPALHERIAPYCHPSMRYKLVSEYREVAFFRGSLGRSPYFAPLLDVCRYRPIVHRQGIRYCLTVDGTHNFLTEVGIVKNCGDSDSALRLLDEMLFEIQQDDLLWAHYQHVSIPGLNVFANIHCRGMRVDTESLDDFGRVMAEDLDERYLQLIAHVPRSIKRQHIDKGLSFSRPDFVRDILFNHPDGLRLKPVQFTKTTEKLSPEQRIASISTKDHLPFFYDADPFVVELASYLKDSRLLNANILRFREKYVYEGAIYPSYNLHTARTGRSASKDPNGQNMPKRGKAAKAYRKAFRAPPGHFILVGDLSQAELRIAGDMAKEPTMIRIYSQDGDIHRETALIVSGKSEEEFALLPKEEQDLLRFKAKAVNFGFIYGMWWRKFRVYAKTQYGVDFSEEEAQRIRRDFFRKYSGLERWHATMRAAAEAQGYVRSYTGRVRHLPMIDSQEEAVKQEALRQAINSPVQETASSWGVMAMAALDREVDARCMTVVGFIHDAIVLYVRKEFLEWGALTLKHYMESVPVEKYFGWRPRIPLKADVSFGEDLSKMYEFKNLNSQSRYDFTPFREEVDIPLQIKPLNCGRYV